MFYVKKTQTIEAVFFDGTNKDEVINFLLPQYDRYYIPCTPYACIVIYTGTGQDSSLVLYSNNYLVKDSGLLSVVSKEMFPLLYEGG
jgi:hypothetical protein